MQSTEILTLESVQIPRFREAYEEVLPAIATMRAPNDGLVEAEVPTLVATVLSVWPKLAAHKARFAHNVSHFDLGQFDRLKQYAMALGHAHSLYVAAAANLADCLAVPEHARALYETLVAKADEPTPTMEPLTAIALAEAIAQRLHLSDDPVLTCRAQALIDKLEAFSYQCAKTQDQLILTGRHRSVLLGLLVATYDRVRINVLTLRNGDPEVSAQFPELLLP